MKTFQAIAPAKINTSLAVSRKESGQVFHEVENIMQTISLHDKMTVSIPENAEELSEIEKKRNRKINDCFGIKYPNSSSANLNGMTIQILIDDHTGQNKQIKAEDNLITKTFLKSAEASEFNEATHVEIWMEKNIPCEAGLGGGSSDAAVALRVAKVLFELDEEQVCEIATSIGADVPFFLAGGRAKMTGFGATLKEKLHSLKNPIVLVKPQSGISTKDCYDKFDEIDESTNEKGKFNLRNDLQKPACSICPEILEVLSFLENECEEENSLMSGSGSACYAICESFNEARKVATLATKKGYWSRACSCVNLKASLL